MDKRLLNAHYTILIHELLGRMDDHVVSLASVLAPFPASLLTPRTGVMSGGAQIAYENEPVSIPPLTAPESMLRGVLENRTILSLSDSEGILEKQHTPFFLFGEIEAMHPAKARIRMLIDNWAEFPDGIAYRRVSESLGVASKDGTEWREPREHDAFVFQVGQNPQMQGYAILKAGQRDGAFEADLMVPQGACVQCGDVLSRGVLWEQWRPEFCDRETTWCFQDVASIVSVE